MSTKTPKPYQVENYKAGSHFAGLRRLSGNQNLTNETKHIIAQAISADPKFQEKKQEYQSKQDQYATDLQSYEELKTKKARGEMTTEDLQMLTELKSKLELGGYKPEIFEGTIQEQLTGGMTEGKINYNGKDYTFVRREGIAKSFEQMGMEVKDFHNWTEATTYLKELFADYADQYPKLFAQEDWYSVSSSDMYPLINQWAQDNNIPYVGWQSSNGYRYGADGELYAWLPVRVGGEFAYVGSDSDVEKASFRCGSEGAAHLSVSFKN